MEYEFESPFEGECIVSLLVRDAEGSGDGDGLQIKINGSDWMDINQFGYSYSNPQEAGGEFFGIDNPVGNILTGQSNDVRFMFKTGFNGLDASICNKSPVPNTIKLRGTSTDGGSLEYVRVEMVDDD